MKIRPQTNFFLVFEREAMLEFMVEFIQILIYKSSDFDLVQKIYKTSLNIIFKLWSRKNEE